jgi:hypothetical protein
LPGERLLLPLLLQEKTLLTNYGPDHPDVIAVRARIVAVREFLAEQSAAAEAKPAQNPPAATPAVLPPPAGEVKPAITPASACVRPEPSPEPVHPADIPPATSTSTHPGKPPEKLSPAALEAVEQHPPVAMASPPALSTPPAPAPLILAPEPIPDLGGPRAPEAHSGPLTTILAALLSGILVHVVALLLILRRHEPRPEQLVRVELVHTPAAGFAVPHSAPAAVWPEASTPGPVEAAAIAPEVIAPPTPIATPEPVGPPGEPADAVLRQVFEDNLRLWDQIENLA